MRPGSRRGCRALPKTILFWGEYQPRGLVRGVDDLTAQFGASVVWILLLLAPGRAAAIALTLHTGFRGGFIFPLFFIGGVSGMALSLATGGWIPQATAALCLMAAMNVAVTRTPISTTVILSTISGASLVPVIGAASLVSFILTTPVTLIAPPALAPALSSGVAKGSRAGARRRF